MATGTTAGAPLAPDSPSGSTGPLTVAVTGGIGSGKSTVSSMFGGHGAAVIDSDRLAREVVASGTPGLAAVVERFGIGVLAADGSLDRTALAAIVFADPGARASLESITHPLVRAASAGLRDRVPPTGIVVNDIPILRELAVAAGFQLVIGVGVADDVRIRRLIDRGMTADDARARIAAQISDGQRRALCDVWIDNNGSIGDLRTVVAALWNDRLVPFAERRLSGIAGPGQPPVLVPPDPDWAALGRLLGARVSRAVDGARVDHIGSTAVPGLPAKDVIDLQLTAPDLATADAWAQPLTAAGFPLRPGFDQDTPHPPSADPTLWRKRLHGNADPGRRVNLHIRVQGSPGWRWALLFPAWLRDDPAEFDRYLTLKRSAASEHGSGTVADYAQAKEPWLADAYPRGLAWADRSGWTP